MDFLKTCTTNVYAVENVGQVRYVLYKPRDEHVSLTIEGWSRLQTTIARLRAENVLCAAVATYLYVFGDIGSEDGEARGTLAIHFDQLEEGSIATPAGEMTKSLRDVFMTAIELSLAYNMAKDPGVLHVGPWTWLYSSAGDVDVEHTDSIVISLRTKLTAADGLYLVSDVMPTDCGPVDFNRYDLDQELMLAPFGKPARLLSANSQKTLMPDEAWKTNIALALQGHALTLPDDTEWVTVELLDETESACFWPLHLCLTAGDRQPKLIGTFAEDYDWRRWFISTEEGAIFRNPLAMTEEWYKGAADRQRAAETTTTVEPKNLSAATATVVPSSATAFEDMDMSTSPPFAQRSADHQSAMAGIYPTPPDGFAPGLASAQISVATPMATQPEVSSSVIEAHAPSGSLQQKGIAPNAQPNEPGDHELAQEDLFGDVGGMAFGDAEIDDAEFDFFDEPDDGFVEPAPIEDSGILDPGTYEGMEGVVAAPNVASSDFVSHDAPPDVTTDSSPKRDLLDTVPVATNDDGLQPQDSTKTPSPPVERQIAPPRRPLSPFGIRERLLPPPVPASHSQSQHGQTANRNERRSSSFTPITFRDSFGATPHYDSVPKPQHAAQVKVASSVVGIGLPTTRKTSRTVEVDDDSDADTSSDSEEDFYMPAAHDTADIDVPPPLPWENRKRKRHVDEHVEHAGSGPSTSAWPGEDESDNMVNAASAEVLMEMLVHYTSTDVNTDLYAKLKTQKTGQDSVLPESTDHNEALETLTGPLPPIENAYNIIKSDLVCVAQIVSEQSATAMQHFSAIVQCYDSDGDGDEGPSLIISRYIRDWLSKAVRSTLPEALSCELADLALARDAQLRQLPNPGKIPQGQPRPPQRLDATQTGPDIFPLPSPYLKLQRGNDIWEMLPACIPFWEPLGLGPAAGTKNLRAFCVFPFNEDLQHLVDHFLRDIGTAYENCKLGTHVHLRDVSELEQDNFKDGLAPVELSEEASLESVLRAYATTCSDLGKALSGITQDEDRAIVIYILNPFTGREARQHLCACFWILFQAYRDSTHKTQLEQGSSDIFLQILPMNMVASYDAFVPLNATKMSLLAREIYDRCPPTSALQLSDVSAPLPNLAAPAVELASTAPKRIGFQLASEAPGDLLYEGSILHVAYARSQDGLWLTASWIDSTGKHQSSSSFCLAGRTFAEVASDVWEHTRTILAARQVLWRVFIVAQEAELDASAVQCWRALAAKPRPQPVCVTMLSTQTESYLQLLPPSTASEPPCYGATEMGVLTPASTPQGATFTSSPDVSGHVGNAPPTPAASETATSLPADGFGESDAQLVDMTNETWGVLLSTKLGDNASTSSMAHGILFQRGRTTMSDTEQVDTVDKLPSLGVNLHWTIQVKTQGGVDEGSVKQAELTLRDVLRMYRGLITLTNARSLKTENGSVLPLHIAMAVLGAAGLEGLGPIDTNEDV